MKPVVIYYSFSGKTSVIAESIAKELGCDCKRIEEERKRSTIGAYVLGAFAAMRGKSSDIKPLNLDFNNYDTIIISTPVWASSPVPAINAFVEQTNFKNKNVVLLIAPASGDDSKTAALLTNRIHTKGGKILQHHGFKTSGASQEDLAAQAREVAKLYK